MKRVGLAILLILAAGAGPCPAQDSLCPPACCPAAEPCCAADGPRAWGSADYLLWWVRKAQTPPLVVTGSPADAFPGALDQPGTRVLFGDRGLDPGDFNGLRVRFGAWLDGESLWGVEAGGFVLERRSVGFSARGDANGQPFLAAPFVSALSGNQNVYFISQNFADPALSALLTGGVATSGATRLWGWEVSGVANLSRDRAWAVDLLAGFRQLSLREDLGYVTAASNLAVGGAAEFEGTPLAPGLTVATADQFRTENLFNGGQLGARIDWRWGPLALDLVGKVALGSTHEVVMIQGLTATNAPLPVTQAVGGIYAQASNGGHHTHDAFAVVPEAGVNLGLDLTEHVRARVGYTFLYVSSVVRPGDQMDTAINTNRVPIDPLFGTPGGPNRPAAELKATGFWAQGLSFGLEITF